MEHSVTILGICSGPVATNGYILMDNATKHAVIIDVPMDSAPWFVEQIEKLGALVQSVYLTHSHWDHTADVVAFTEQLAVPVYCHRDDEYRLVKPNDYLGFPLPFSFVGCSADRFFEHGEKLLLGETELEVRHTPGHTEGGVCFVIHAEKVVFVGDTLFNGSIGRTDLHGGNHSELIASIHQHLLSLPNEYQCFCGHGNSTSIGIERDSNPFLRL